MPKAYEIITGRVLNPGATITALTANSGSSFVVRAFNSTARAWLEGVWSQNATAGVARVRSPKMHDSTQGIRYRTPAATIRDFVSDFSKQPLYPTDTLVVEASGGGAETDCLALAVYYEDLDGSDAKLASWEQIAAQVVNLLTVEVAVTGPATAGDWSAGVALNSFTDLLKADTKYALLGYQTDTEVCAVGIQGPDTGNYRVGGPGCIEPLETRDWFVRQSRDSGLPHIPILNSNNKGGTTVAVTKATAAGTINIDLSLAELA